MWETPSALSAPGCLLRCTSLAARHAAPRLPSTTRLNHLPIATFHRKPLSRWALMKTKTMVIFILDFFFLFKKYSHSLHAGVTHSLTAQFTARRETRASEYRNRRERAQNRLGKLIALYRDTPKARMLVSRKALEQTIVPWTPLGKDSQCHVCGSPLGHRWGEKVHNCRLCGELTCGDCILFLPISHLGKPRHELANSSALESTVEICRSSCFDAAAPLNVQGDKDQEALRLLQQLHDKLSTAISSAGYLLPGLRHSLQMLQSTDLSYAQYTAVSDMHRETEQRFHDVDVLSKRILSLPFTAAANQRLAERIRARAATFLAENKMSLPPMPVRKSAY
eukprot:m.25400 g.25400  ORF g.25400 m.25400 type:complete len:337 (-) comp11364_c0_seq1:77-1087(-)